MAGESYTGVGPAAEGVESGLFVRKATGLVRELGLRDAFTLNFMVANAGTGFVVIFVALAVFPQAELTGSFLIAGLAALLLVLSYIQLIGAIPRTGGDYVFVSRIFHPVAGAAIGGTLLLVFMYINGVNSVVWGQTFFPFFFEAFGQAVGSSGVENIAGKVSGQTPSFLIATGTFVILALIALRGLRAISLFMFSCFLIGIVGLLVVFGEYLAHGTSSFASIFNENANVPDAYSKVISTAEAEGLKTGVSANAVLSASTFAALLLIGISWSVYPGGELKRPMRTTKYGMLLGLGFALAVYIGAWLTLRNMAGLHFLQAASWLSSNDPDAYGKITDVQPLGNTLALLVSGDPVTKTILAITFPAWNLALLMAYYLVVSRIVFAQSFDRMLPVGMAKVTERTHAPVYAIALATIGFISFSALAIYTSVLADLFRNATLLFMFVFTVVSLAAMALPWLKPALYEASPKVFPGKWLGLPPIAVIGALSAIANGTILYLVARNSALSGGYDWKSALTLIGICLWGVAAYLVSRAYFKARGVDIGLAMRELPPE